MPNDVIPHEVARAAVAWVETSGGAPRLSFYDRALLVALVEGSERCSSLDALLAELRIPSSSAAYRMWKKRLPAPGRWHRFGRALGAALYLQAHPEEPLWRASMALGYAEHSRLHHTMRRTFGVRCGEIRLRRAYGWEWLLASWWARERVRRVATVAGGAR